MIEKLQDYFESEYRLTRTAMQSDSPYVDRHNSVWYAVQRCLGAAQFAQTMGARYLEVEPIFEEIKARLMKLEG